MKTVQLQQRGVITLPKRMRDALGLSEGQSLSIRQEHSSIIIEPHHDVDPHVIAAVRDGLDDLKHGRFVSFTSIPEFKKKMKAKYGNTVD